MVNSSVKTCETMGCAEPKDPMTMEAWTGFLDTRSWTGMSFCVWGRSY